MTASRRSWRLGVVPYLNVQPLIAHLSTPRDDVDIVAAVPSRLAPMLAEGAVDVAIVPVFALLDHPEWAMVPRVGIASPGEVMSVAVLSASPREEITRVILDPASMTSAALVQILFRRAWGQQVEFIRRSKPRLAPEPGAAHLVIGDRALQLRRQLPHIIDLGAAWRAWTGLPFVFAVWAVRPGIDLGPLAERLAAAPDHFTPAVARSLARQYHREVHLTVAETETYLTANLQFRLGRAEMMGLRRYLRECSQMGFGPRRLPRLRILPRDGHWRRGGDALTG